MEQILNWIKKSGRVIYSTQGHEHQLFKPIKERKHQLNLIYTNDVANLIIKFNEEFLQWMVEQGFVKYKDDTWYKRGSWRPWEPVKYYTHKQLIELYEKS